VNISTLILLLIYALVAALNTAAHWLPWDIVPALADERGRMRRLAAYVYGTLTILLGCVLGALAESLTGTQVVDVWSAVLFLAGAIVSAGVGTLIPYCIDTLREGKILAADVEDYEQTLEG
jgi:urea transporter